MVQTIAANSEIQVSAEGAKVTSGSLSAPTQVAGDLVSGLGNRFAEAQRYTTTRRSAPVGENAFDDKLSTIAHVVLSGTYPDLVWANADPKDSYGITIDGKAEHKVAATSEPVVRYRLSGLTAGRHTFRITVFDGAGKAGASSADGEIVWLSAHEDAALRQAEETIRSLSPGDDFSIANLLDEKGLTVAAMDSYRKHFAAHSNDNEMRPLLIRVYSDLGLADLKTAELQTYRKMAASR
ncbi:MAG: hypothetical protein HQL37_07480 [Alphaproteobacteria bacterium]|nr:hypothetical protein [Alphaproteobacteria bacterium]